MSLITVNLTPFRALVCVDTEGFAPGVGLIEVSKLVRCRTPIRSWRCVA